MNILKEVCCKKEKYMRIPSGTAKSLYFYSEWAGEFSCTDDFYILRSGMKSYLLLYTLSGSGVLKYNGKTEIADKNSVLFLDCEKIHEYYTKTEPWRFKFIHFYGNQAKKYYGFISELYGASVLHCGKAPNIESLFDNVILCTKKACNEAECSEYIYRILTALICSVNDKNISFDIKRITSYISDNYMKIYDVDTLAQRFNFSRSYFTTQFTKAMGVSPYHYLTECKISAAKQFLINTDLSVFMIASNCGFSSCSSFIRAFKSKTGLSPLSYRKSKF